MSAYCRSLGAAMAAMHVAGADFPMTRANDLSVSGWRPLLEACGMKSNQIYHGLYNALNQELAMLEKAWPQGLPTGTIRSEEHTSELQSLMRISYAVFCLKK